MGNFCSFDEDNTMVQSKSKDKKRSQSANSDITPANTKKVLSVCLILKVGKI